MDENDFSGLKSISKYIKKIQKKLTVRGGEEGVNAYSQPDRKISVFYDFSYIIAFIQHILSLCAFFNELLCAVMKPH